jgi:diguanylate cyclase (GGDEF)-like protein
LLTPGWLSCAVARKNHRFSLFGEFSFADLVVVAVCVAVVVFLRETNAFTWFYGLALSNPRWNLDIIANGFFIGFIGLIVMLTMRHKRLHREVRRRMLAEAQAEMLARHDPLTGIANRRLFNEHLQRMVADSRNGSVVGALMVFDLNRFKSVNDIYGHAVGDDLLVAVAERVQALLRHDDIFARLGGDEFGIAIPAMARDAVVRLANRIIAALDQPFEIGELHVDIGTSIGIAFLPQDAADTETLIQRADLAMYRAKTAGVSGHAFFEPTLDEAVRDRARLQADLRQAVGTDAMVPFYQPLVDLTTGETNGFEMLARWNHPTRGILMPDLFIPLAEDSRLIGALSLGLLRKAVRDALTWDPRLFLSINISPEQFTDRDLATKILSILAVADFPPTRLEIELTETALVADLPGAKEIILQLKRVGVRIAIDDFGSGYSSLFYLRELPFDVVKIDQGFVGTRSSNPESAKIVSAVIGLTRALGISTVAEGIEEIADAHWLREQGCDVGQGFLYSPPLPASEVQEYLDDRQLGVARA